MKSFSCPLNQLYRFALCQGQMQWHGYTSIQECSSSAGVSSSQDLQMSEFPLQSLRYDWSPGKAGDTWLGQAGSKWARSDTPITAAVSSWPGQGKLQAAQVAEALGESLHPVPSSRFPYILRASAAGSSYDHNSSINGRFPLPVPLGNT